MKSNLDTKFKDVKESFPSHLRISFELMNFHHTIDKECSGTAKYHKGQGAECYAWLADTHPDVVKLPIVRTLGGTRMDIEFEAYLGSYYL